MTIQTFLEFDNNSLIPLLYGEHNAHLTYIEKKLGVNIADRGNRLSFSGDAQAIKTAQYVLNTLWDKLEKKQMVGTAEIDAALRFFNDRQKNGKADTDKDEDSAHVLIRTKKKSISARTPNQKKYIEMIQKNEMVFGIGPAGTGKTYLAVAAGVAMFLEGKVERLVFCRPAVEAGENLGFLPGDMKEKVDPYLRPIYDALHDTLHWDYMMKKMETGEIEIAPLAFMRGRTLANAFVVLDEAQNATCGQMKMFLTRMGEASRMVITGDLTQTDLPRGVKSGLQDAQDILENVPEIQFMYFNSKDVVRHHLVGKIIEAYEQFPKKSD
ncbi:MAG: PhoH family protein [Alphaproteobacteria bacterium]